MKVLACFMLLAVAGCSDDGPFKFSSEIKTKSTTSLGLAHGEGEQPNDQRVSKTKPALKVTGSDQRMSAGLKTALEKAGVGKQGHVVVTVTAKPSAPKGRSGNVDVEIQIDALWAHLPAVTSQVQP